MENRVENPTKPDVDKFLVDLKAALRDGEELLKSGMGSIKERAAKGARRTDQFVHERPYETMGIVFCLGALAGLLVSGLISRTSSE